MAQDASIVEGKDFSQGLWIKVKTLDLILIRNREDSFPLIRPLLDTRNRAEHTGQKGASSTNFTLLKKQE